MPCLSTKACTERERDIYIYIYYTYPALRLIQVLPGHPLADPKDETVSSPITTRAINPSPFLVNLFIYFTNSTDMYRLPVRLRGAHQR